MTQIAYLDSSAFVKLYVTEPGSEEGRRLLDSTRTAATCAVAYVEVRAALARRWRDGTISTRSYKELNLPALRDGDSEETMRTASQVRRP